MPSKMMRIITNICIIAVSVMSLSFPFLCVRAAEIDEDINIIDALYMKGLISDEEYNNAEIVNLNLLQGNGIQGFALNDSDSNVEAIIVRKADGNEEDVDLLVPMVETKDGSLVGYSSYINVPTRREVEQLISQIDFCVVKIKVQYNYFYPQHNGYAYPFYQHGSLSVRVEHSVTTQNNYISNLDVRYLSRGMTLDPDTHSSTGFKQHITSLSLPKVITNTTYTISGGDAPYFWRDSSTIEYGAAISGVAYTFTYKNVAYGPYSFVIQQDNEDFWMDIGTEFDWGF